MLRSGKCSLLARCRPVWLFKKTIRRDYQVFPNAETCVQELCLCGEVFENLIEGNIKPLIEIVFTFRELPTDIKDFLLAHLRQ